MPPIKIERVALRIYKPVILYLLQSFFSTHRKTRKLAARTFFQLQYLRALLAFVMSGKEALETWQLTSLQDSPYNQRW